MAITRTFSSTVCVIGGTRSGPAPMRTSLRGRSRPRKHIKV